MYTRSYYPDSASRPSLPDNYDGTALVNDMITDTPGDQHSINEYTEASAKNKQEGGSLVSGLLGGFLSGGSQGIRLPSIGTEEILLIGMAAFLFFSHDGDKECALLLMLLLLIN